MPNTSSISVPQVGMNTDLFSFNSEGKIYPFALNADLEDLNGNGFSIQNSQSNRLAINFPAGFRVIGRIEIHEQDRVLYALVNTSTGESKIGEVQNCSFNDDSDDIDGIYGCENCTHPEQRLNTPLEETTQTPYCDYRTIIEADCFNFNIDYPVLFEYRITDCGINVYFTDKFNDRRFMYFTYTDDDIRNPLLLDDRFKVIVGYTPGDCPQPIYGDELDCNKINYNPAHTIPCISEMDVISGGSLKAGVYQALISSADAEGNTLSEFGAATQPIPVFTRYITTDTNYQTDKAISITINGLDTNTLFGYYNLVIAETIDNFTTFKFAGTFPVTKNTFVYTGDDKTLPTLTSEQVLFKRPYYKTAGSITASNNFLFFGDVAEFKKPNLQAVASGIKIYWQTVAIPEAVYSKPENAWKFRSLMRDEVYPFGLVPVATNGEEFCAIHVPGREAVESDLEIVDNNDVLEDTSCNNLTRTARWQVYNTATASGTTQHELTVDCDDSKCWESGETAYWESIELYPNDPVIWGDLCGKPIRHHKMPDSCVTHIHNNLDGASPYATNNIVYPLGIRVDHQSVIDAFDLAVTNGIITQAERDRIAGYRVVRGNRVGHKSVVAKGLLFDMWSYDKFNQKWYYANYPYNDLTDDDFISNDPDTYDGSNTSDPIPNVFVKTSRYTFHSPDTHFVNPTLGTELHLETEEYGESEGYFNHCEDEAKYRLISTFAATFAFAAGIAAAWSATGEKECIAYSTTSDAYNKSKIEGETPVGIVTGGGGTLTDGTGTISANSTSVTNHSFTANTTGSDTDNSTSFNHESFTPYGKQSGSTIGQAPIQIANKTETTCTGSPYQLLSPINTTIIGITSLLNQTIYRIVLGLNELEIMKKLIMSLLPLKNFAVQYNSVGKYNNYKCVAKDTGNKIRKILTKAYLNPENQTINEDYLVASGGTFSSIFINNWERESSVYLQTDNGIPLPNPTVIDNSRGTMDEFGLDYDDLGKRVYRNISSYYASIKNFVPDQYGDIYKIDYLDTNGCVFYLSQSYDDCSHVFGGDVFINRFALKIKIPFFLQSRFGTIDEGDVKYSELGNVGFPNYYFNSHETILEKIEDEGLLSTLLSLRDLSGAPRSRLDAKTAKLFYQNGYIHLYNYGIPYFLVESDINVDLRYGTDSKAHDFYPHQSNLDFWLQKKNVDIAEDNFYDYNRTYSKQNHESVICTNQPTFDSRDCKTTHPNRVIYYEETNASKFGDNWIIARANNFYDFPPTLGKLISIDVIENEKVLVSFENGMQVFNAYDTLKTEGGTNIQLGTGGVFAARPKEFSKTTLGYGGSQHKAILNTEYGHVKVDAKRGQVFNLSPNAESLDEISKDGKKNWFKENLPFTLLKQFPTIQDNFLDNTFRGIGIAMAFDKRFNRFFLTKRDYKRLNNNIIEDSGHFYIETGEPTLSCASGYTLVGDECVKTTTVPAEQINTLPSFIPVSRTNAGYGSFGSVIYDAGYNLNGTGTFTALDPALTNSTWSNPSPYTSLLGPVNRTGIWNSLGDDPIDEWVGVAKEIDVPETKIYYVGVAGDNKARIKIGCNLIVDFDPDAMALNHGTDTQVTFKLFHIYPVLLTKGKNYVELYGLNLGSVAVFAAEIYDNTKAELFAANTVDDLNILFSTHDLIGEEISNFNYVCPDCQAPIQAEDLTYNCVTTLTQDPISTPNRFEVFLDDSQYFCNKSWTISYNFFTKSWTSYHSFIPNYYVEYVNHFDSGVNNTQSSVWSHGVTNKSYQVYYGTLYPFIIELSTDRTPTQNFVRYINYDLEVLRYHNEYDWAEKRDITFNKAIVFNKRQCSGLLELVIKDEENLEDTGRYPEITSRGIKIDVTNSNNVWNFNQFYDNVNSQVSNIPIWLNDCANVDKRLNPKAFDYYGGEQTNSLIKGQQTFTRLINDKESNYKFVFKFLINNQSQFTR